MKRRAAVVLGLASVLAIAFPSGATVPSSIDATVSGFNPAVIVAFRPDSFTFRALDVPHTFSTTASICEDIFGALAACDTIAFPGGSVTVKIHEDAPTGIHTFFCIFHAGMRGTIAIPI